MYRYSLVSSFSSLLFLCVYLVSSTCLGTWDGVGSDQVGWVEYQTGFNGIKWDQ